MRGLNTRTTTGVFSYISGGERTNSNNSTATKISFDASHINDCYKNEVTTLTPPSVKIRVKTRYK